MSNIAYFNFSEGVSGDMVFASLLSAAKISAKVFEKELKAVLGFKNFSLTTSESNKIHFPCMKVCVKGDWRFKNPYEMRAIIANSKLSKTSKNYSLRALDNLITAEAKVHNVSKTKVHFHQINAVDTLIDLTAPFLLLEKLNVSEVYASIINTGKAAPATLKILCEHKMQFNSTNCEYELATPTGAAIASIFKVTNTMPALLCNCFGYGCGSSIRPDGISVLRVIIGSKVSPSKNNNFSETICLLETNIDDMDPRIFPYVVELTLAAGANDAWLTNIVMKKGRIGTQFSVLCEEKLENKMCDIIFKETTTLGIRKTNVLRTILRRDANGKIKTAYLQDGSTRKKSEFEYAKKSAQKLRVPLKELLR